MNIPSSFYMQTCIPDALLTLYHTKISLKKKENKTQTTL